MSDDETYNVDAAIATAKAEAYELGRIAGYKAGFNEGHTQGHEEGYAKARQGWA